MRWLRPHREDRPLIWRPQRVPTAPVDDIAPESESAERTLSRWLATDSLTELCHAALEEFQAECGLSRLLLVAWGMKRPTAWALAPDDPVRSRVQDWYDCRRRRAVSPRIPPGEGTVESSHCADADIDPELARLGFHARTTVAVDQCVFYEVFWSTEHGDRDVAGESVSTGMRSAPVGADERGPLWRLLRLALVNHARMEHLRELSHIDTLTGVFNRRYFNLRLLEEMARAERFERPLALVIADLDQFKPLNDTRGHQVGDVVLRYVSQTVRHAVRSIDILCRLGGDEFAVVMPDTDTAECVMLGERLCRAVADGRLTIGGPGEKAVLQMHVSLGGAVFPEHADRAERLLWCADMSLLEAKRRGGNQFVFHDELVNRPPSDGCFPVDTPPSFP